MHGLFLYGMNGTNEIWDGIRDAFAGHEMEYAEYPHEVTQAANGVEDVARWVGETYQGRRFDLVVGHSMGGIIALELLAKGLLQAKALILIESNLRPANPFYRNLLLPDNEEQWGSWVRGMIQRESPFYSNALKKSLQEGFDYTGFVPRYPGKIFGLYGDRGQKNSPNRIPDLCLNEETLQRIQFHFIPNACHMPMVENSMGTATAILACLEQI